MRHHLVETLLGLRRYYDGLFSVPRLSILLLDLRPSQESAHDYLTLEEKTQIRTENYCTIVIIEILKHFTERSRIGISPFIEEEAHATNMIDV